MNLHNILYAASILCMLIGVAGVDGWMCNGTSLALPLVLIGMSVPLWMIAKKEDGKGGKGRWV